MNATPDPMRLHGPARTPSATSRRTFGLGGALALSVAALLLGLLALAAPALAAPGWLTPVNLSEAGQNAANAQVAMDPTGNAVAVWSRSNGTNTIVQAAAKPTFGETWSTAENLSEAGQNAANAQVAMDAAGDAVAIWERSNGTNTIVQTASRPTGGSWSTPENLSAAGQNATVPQVAVDPAGDAVAVWLRSNGTNTIVQTASRPAGGSWSSPENLSEAGQNATLPQVGIDAAGDAVAVWLRSNGTNTIAQTATRPAGGSWSTPENLSAAGQSATVPQVSVNAAGEAIAVWTRSNGTNIIVQATDRPAGGSWSTPVDLSEAGQSAGTARVALNAAGDAVAAWRRSNGTNEIIQAATRPAGGSWSSPTDLSEPGANATAVKVAIYPEGAAVAIWSRPNGVIITQAAGRPAGGSWSAAVDISEAGRSATVPQLAIDSGGDAVAVWQRSNGTNIIAQAVGFATGPHLLSLSIPASGTVGETLPFSAGWWDAWSPISSIKWDLGDGATTEGGAVSHTYGAIGTYTVGVIATDGRGESATTGGEVTIKAAPVPPQPEPTQTGQTPSGQTGGGSGQGGGSSVGAPSPGGSHKKHHKVRPPKKKKPAALTISLSPSTGFARPTSVLTYRITVANPGGSAAKSVKVCNELPDGQSALRAQPRADGGASSCWSLGTLDAGARRTLRLSVQVDALAAGGAELDRAVASAANVTGTRADTATVRIRALPATACGSSLSGSPLGHIVMRC